MLTTQIFRDTAAWYHIVLAVDTTDGTAADRTKIYVNGVNQTLYSNGTYDTSTAQNYDCHLQSRHYLLGIRCDGNNAFSGYVAEIHLLDG